MQRNNLNTTNLTTKPVEAELSLEDLSLKKLDNKKHKKLIMLIDGYKADFIKLSNPRKQPKITTPIRSASTMVIATQKVDVELPSRSLSTFGKEEVDDENLEPPIVAVIPSIQAPVPSENKRQSWDTNITITTKETVTRPKLNQKAVQASKAYNSKKLKKHAAISKSKLSRSLEEFPTHHAHKEKTTPAAEPVAKPIVLSYEQELSKQKIEHLLQILEKLGGIDVKSKSYNYNLSLWINQQIVIIFDWIRHNISDADLNVLQKWREQCDNKITLKKLEIISDMLVKQAPPSLLRYGAQILFLAHYKKPMLGSSIFKAPTSEAIELKQRQSILDELLNRVEKQKKPIHEVMQDWLSGNDNNASSIPQEDFLLAVTGACDLCIRLIEQFSAELKNQGQKYQAYIQITKYWQCLLALMQFSEKLTDEQKVYRLTNDILSAVNFKELTLKVEASKHERAISSRILGEGKSITLLDLERDYLQNCLDAKAKDRYSVTAVKGNHSHVYFIKDNSNDTTVIVRSVRLYEAEIENNQTVYDLAAKYSAVLSSLAGNFALIEGYIDQGLSGAKGNREFHCYVIAEYLPNGNLESKFENLHKNTNDVESLQFHFIVYAKQILKKILIDLEKSGLCYADLKPSNLQIAKDGSLKVSDIKSFISVASYQDLNIPIDLCTTPLFATGQSTDPSTGKVNLTQRLLETLLFSFYTMMVSEPRKAREILLLDREKKKEVLTSVPTLEDIQQSDIDKSKNIFLSDEQRQQILLNLLSDNNLPIFQGEEIGKKIQAIFKNLYELVFVNKNSKNLLSELNLLLKSFSSLDALSLVNETANQNQLSSQQKRLKIS